MVVCLVGCLLEQGGYISKAINCSGRFHVFAPAVCWAFCVSGCLGAFLCIFSVCLGAFLCISSVCLGAFLCISSVCLGAFLCISSVSWCISVYFQCVLVHFCVFPVCVSLVHFCVFPVCVSCAFLCISSVCVLVHLCVFPVCVLVHFYVFSVCLGAFVCISSVSLCISVYFQCVCLGAFLCILIVFVHPPQPPSGMAFALRTADAGSAPHLPLSFFPSLSFPWSSHTRGLKTGTVLPTLPGLWR